MEKINDSLEKIRAKYKNHAVILAILNQQFGNSFSFRIIPNEEIETKANLNEAKAFQQSDTAWKSVQKRSFSGPYFPAFSLNTEVYVFESKYSTWPRKHYVRNDKVFK